MILGTIATPTRIPSEKPESRMWSTAIFASLASHILCTGILLGTFTAPTFILTRESEAGHGPVTIFASLVYHILCSGVILPTLPAPTWLLTARKSKAGLWPITVQTLPCIKDHPRKFVSLTVPFSPHWEMIRGILTALTVTTDAHFDKT
jgi:hypothetical protein